MKLKSNQPKSSAEQVVKDSFRDIAVIPAKRLNASFPWLKPTDRFFDC
jgi:hypothetical protein